MIEKAKVPESLLEIFAQNPEYSAKLDSLINAKDKVPLRYLTRKMPKSFLVKISIFQLHSLKNSISADFPIFVITA